MEKDEQPVVFVLPSALDADPVQTLAEDVLTRAPKKRRLLSDKQKEVLRQGRTYRWPKNLNSEEEPSGEVNTQNQKVGIVPQPVQNALPFQVQAFLDPNTSPSESDGNTSSSSSDEEDEKKNKRKAKKLLKSIPKAVRRRLDRYLKMKMKDVKFQAQVERETTLDEMEQMPLKTPVLQRQNAQDYKSMGFDYALNFL